MGTRGILLAERVFCITFGIAILGGAVSAFAYTGTHPSDVIENAALAGVLAFMSITCFVAAALVKEWPRKTLP